MGIKPKPATISDVRSYFSEELKHLMIQRHMESRTGAFEYLVELLIRNVESESFFTKTPEGKMALPTLFEIYSQYLQGDSIQQRLLLQKLGDLCLVISGIFPDSLKRKLVDLDYYQGMGGSAYFQLSHFDDGTKSVFLDLSKRFRAYADLLSEFSERSGLQTNSDLLRLYEKWLLTGSDRLRLLLKEKGIFSIPVDTKVKH